MKRILLVATGAFLFVAIAALQLSTMLHPAVAHATTVEDTIGSISPPPGVDVQNANSGLSSDEVAIFFFLSNLLKVVNVVAGIWVAFNVVLAAFNYLSGQGSPDAHKKVRDKLTMSVVGLFILVISYAVVAMLSMLFFGDAGYILNPTL